MTKNNKKIKFISIDKHFERMYQIGLIIGKGDTLEWWDWCMCIGFVWWVMIIGPHYDKDERKTEK